MLLHLITNPHITEADLVIYINVNLEAKGKRGAKQEKKKEYFLFLLIQNTAHNLMQHRIWHFLIMEAGLWHWEVLNTADVSIM